MTTSSSTVVNPRVVSAAVDRFFLPIRRPLFFLVRSVGRPRGTAGTAARPTVVFAARTAPGRPTGVKKRTPPVRRRRDVSCGKGPLLGRPGVEAQCLPPPLARPGALAELPGLPPTPTPTPALPPAPTPRPMSAPPPGAPS